MIKADIISGFLGAGKTTLISKLIKEKLKDEKVVLIENEFGEIGIDGGFLKEAGIIINEMNSGCICCSLVGDFETALKKVVETYSPDRIIIEPSGVGKLSDVLNAVKKISDININSYSTVVDVNKAKLYFKNFKEFFNDQIEAASCVILSKTQNTTSEKLKETIEIVKLLNPLARVVTTSWDDLTGEDLLKVMEGSVKLIEEHCSCGCHEHHHEEHDCGCHEHHHEEHDCGCHEHHHEEHDCGCHEHHHAEDHFTSMGFETINRYSKTKIEEILSNFDKNVIRAKGIVQDDNDQWLFFDYVPEEIDVRNGKPSYTGLITVIGTRDMDQEKIKKAFGIQ